MNHTPIALVAAALALNLAGAAQAAAPAATLRVEGEQFVLTLPDGRRLTSVELVGAELTTEAGETLRIDAVTPSKERPGVLLHSLSALDPVTRTWGPACEADAYGRQAGFPVAGRWEGSRYVKDAKHWFLTCTSGSQAKCILWGYDPWSKGPHGEDLAPFYQACQFVVRANYDGRGESHTKNGTTIDVADAIGLQTYGDPNDPTYGFEAGWGLKGAVCVARTRWSDLLALDALWKSAPRLAGRCDEATARRKGALIFTRVQLKPVLTSPP